MKLPLLPIFPWTGLLVFLTATLTAGPACAEDLAPGLWEITIESRAPADSGWTPSPFSLTQCLTAGDAEDPSRLISSISTPGAKDCNYTDKSYSGGTFRFTLDCSGSFGLKSEGSVTFGANSFNGSIRARGNVGGQTVEFHNRVSARRLGAC